MRDEGSQPFGFFCDDLLSLRNFIIRYTASVSGDALYFYHPMQNATIISSLFRKELLTKQRHSFKQKYVSFRLFMYPFPFLRARPVTKNGELHPEWLCRFRIDRSGYNGEQL